MVKNIIIILITSLFTFIVTILSISWQDEALSFNITSPVNFGGVYYHNIKIHNKGWNPAVNVKLEIKGVKHSQIIKVNSTPEFDGTPKKGVGKFSRLRRNEVVNIAILTKQPISEKDIIIKSDRSIAIFSEDQAWFFDLYSFIIGILGLMIINILIVIFAKRQFEEFRAKAEQAVCDADMKEMFVAEAENNIKLREELEARKSKKT